MGGLTPTTAFEGRNLILCLYDVDTLNICMKEFGLEKIILTKWQLWELRQFFSNGAFVYALIVPSWADQLLPQSLMEQFDTLHIQCRHIEHMHEGVWFRKNNFWQNDSSDNLDNFSLYRAFVYALMVPSWADQLLPQLLMEQFDTLLIQCRHIEHMYEGVWFRKSNFWQNDSCENLDNFSVIGILYMHE